jgi:hypothetical protein
MEYQKPEITLVGQAIEAVQFIGKAGENKDCGHLPSASECPPDE